MESIVLVGNIWNPEKYRSCFLSQSRTDPKVLAQFRPRTEVNMSIPLGTTGSDKEAIDLYILS
jgi:hypothetical protein